jgi:cephalosporin hydroxylase
MRLTIDTTEQKLICETTTGTTVMGLYTQEAFDLISQQWVKVGWNQKYPYTFTWFGRPIIQLPEDMVRLQEVIYRVRPDVIVETGVAHGGSLIYYASLCKAMNRGRVIGIDVEIRPQNRDAIQNHELGHLIKLITGDSTAQDIIRHVHSLINPGETVLVILDSNHSKQHVTAELESYHDLVTRDSYIIATDGVMKDLYDVPRGNSDWKWDNPSAAAAEFVARHPEFALEPPPWNFNESDLSDNPTHWPGGWLRRL